MKYITIGRQYGSGGRLIGKALSEKLGIPCYDSELIQLASVKSGISPEYIEALDEKGTANFFHSLMLNASPMGTILPNYFNMTTNDQLFFMQSDIIRELAKKGDAIFVGRCADYILDGKDTLNVFIHAPKDYRIKTIARRSGVNEKEASERMSRTDKKRKAYYNHYTPKDWGAVDSYHFALDSSKFDQPAIIDLIIRAYNGL